VVVVVRQRQRLVPVPDTRTSTCGGQVDVQVLAMVLVSYSVLYSHSEIDRNGGWGADDDDDDGREEKSIYQNEECYEDSSNRKSPSTSAHGPTGQEHCRFPSLVLLYYCITVLLYYCITGLTVLLYCRTVRSMLPAILSSLGPTGRADQRHNGTSAPIEQDLTVAQAFQLPWHT
jgi:hypothetical protein